MFEQLIANLSGRVRREQCNGKPFLVAPMRMIVSGVLPGSQGPLLYPPDELAKTANDWNGIPIVVDHPQRNGQWVSAQAPGLLARQGIGFVLAARLTGNGEHLDAEGWFDEFKTRRVDSRILEAIEADQPLELRVHRKITSGFVNGGYAGHEAPNPSR